MGGSRRAIVFMLVGRGCAALCLGCADAMDSREAAFERLRAVVAARPERHDLLV